jgi:DOMON domain
MKKHKLILLILCNVLLFKNNVYSKKEMKLIEKNGMKVRWEHQASRIYFDMEAPTDGWVAIGFNHSENTTGNYLLMGNIVNGVVNVVEHYTSSPGSYQSFEALKTNPSVADVEGKETVKNTYIRFSLPVKATNSYARNLSPPNEYVLLMAYSREDDFQHHSMMRTSSNIKL